MATRPTVDPDPLGIIADTEGIPMPLSDWQGIARLGLTYEQVVRLYGQPPKEALPLFRPAAKGQRPSVRRSGPSAPRSTSRSTTRA